MSRFKVLFKAVTWVLVFVIRLRFPNHRSIADIIRDRYGPVLLKNTRKYEALDYKLRKCEKDLEFLNICKNSGLIPNFICFKVANRSLRCSKAYRICQQRLLNQEIGNKKTLLKRYKRDFDLLKKKLGDTMDFMDLTHIIILFTNSNDKKLMKVTDVHTKKLFNLGLGSKEVSDQHDPDKVIFNFSTHVLSNEEKLLLVKGLNFSIPPEKLNLGDFLLPFELMFRSIKWTKGFTPQALDGIKIELKRAAYSCYNNYNFFRELNLTKEEYATLKNLRNCKDIIIQKSDKANSIVLIDRTSYVTLMNDLLMDNTKFEKVNVNNDKVYNFMIDHQEEPIKKFLTKLRNQSSISNELFNELTPCGSKPGVLYGLAKTHKELVNGLPKMRPIISAIGTPTYKLAKFLVGIFSVLTRNDYTLKDSFEFASIIDQKQHGNFMASLDVDALFTNVPLDETIDILLDQLFATSTTVNNLTREELRKMIELTTKESVFMFDGSFYKQKDGVAMGSPLGPIIANIFLCHHETIWLNDCPTLFSPSFYKRYVDDIFVVFKTEASLVLFKDYLNSKHPNIHFTDDPEKNTKLPFLDVLVNRDNNNILSTNLYRKSCFSGIFSNFQSYMPTHFKRGLILTLLFRCFNLSSNYMAFHHELERLKLLLKKNGYPMYFIDKIVKFFLDKIHTEKKVVITVPKKVINIVVPFLGKYSLVLRKNLLKLFENKILYHCKLNVTFKTSNRISHYFKFKDRCPNTLRSSIVYMYTCGGCNTSYVGKSSRHCIARTSEHLGISPRTGKPVKGMLITPVKEHAIYCTTRPVVDDFKVIGSQSDGNNYLLELKESIFIYQHGPKLNKDTTSRPLHLFV